VARVEAFGGFKSKQIGLLREFEQENHLKKHLAVHRGLRHG